MTEAMLKLPASVRLDALPAIWAELEAALLAESLQVGAGAGQVLHLNAAPLTDFDSGVLTLLLSAARLCRQRELQLQVFEVPAKLQELARVYGVGDLLWPEQAPAADQLA
ncbi:MAG: STAS domain-containing protein [Burkholderiaceae bacterium]|nr:STAS domain-containing protein [Roseateles sp.]MBV8469995.1 STAS domain-containing protein [Burkholderiaceae bacterium]